MFTWPVPPAPALPPLIVGLGTPHHRARRSENARRPGHMRRHRPRSDGMRDSPRPYFARRGAQSLRKGGVAIEWVLWPREVARLKLEPTLASGMAVDIEGKASVLRAEGPAAGGVEARVRRGRGRCGRGGADGRGRGGSAGFEPQRHLGVVPAGVVREAVLASSRSVTTCCTRGGRT